MADTVITNLGAAIASAAGTAGAHIDIVGFQIGSDVISSPPSATATSVSTLSYPTAPSTDPNTLVPGTLSKITYQIINGDTMLFKITLDASIGGTSGFNIGNIGLLVANPAGGYALFSLTALPAVEYKYASNPPLIGNQRVYNIAIKLTGISSVINLTTINTDNYVLPTVANRAGLPAVGSAASPVYIVNSDATYNNTQSLAIRGTVWSYIPIDTGWSNAGDISVYAHDSSTTPNVVTIAVQPAITTLTAGRQFVIDLNTTNTGAATLNVNGLGAIGIINPDGTPLFAGQLLQNAMAYVVYDGTHFQLTSDPYASVNKNGDTVYGNLTVNGLLQSNTAVNVNGGTGTTKSLYFLNNGAARWSLSSYNDAEGSGNTGSTFIIGAYNNSAGYINSYISIARATGVTSFYATPTAPTATNNDNSNNLATTAFVQTLIQSGANLVATDTSFANTIVASITPAPASLYAGLTAFITVAAANTLGTVTVNLNGFGAKNLMNPDGSLLQVGQIKTGSVIQVFYTGTKFLLMSSPFSPVNRAGDSMNGYLTVNGPIQSTSTFNVNNTTGTLRGMYGFTTGVYRWFSGTNGDAESGGNTGSNYAISRYNDAGTIIDTPFIIGRSTGTAFFNAIPQFPTAAAGDSSNQGANTQFVATAIAANVAPYAVDTGVANAMVATSTPVVTALAAGTNFRVKVLNANTSATVTLNINGLGVKSVVNADGSSLQVGQLPANAIVTVVYDGTKYQIQSTSVTPLNKAGDTVNGALTVTGILQTNNQVIINGPAASYRVLAFASSGSSRWIVDAEATAESGANAGSDFNINRCSDAGAIIGTPFSISRATGNVNITNGLTVGYTISTGNTISANSYNVGGAAATNRGLNFLTNGAQRWYAFVNGAPEDGLNLSNGSNFEIGRYNDIGSYVDSPFTINRRTGIAAFVVSPTAPTANASDNSTKLATTAYVDRQSGAVLTASNVYCVDSSTNANTIIATPVPGVTGLPAGSILRIKVANTNTSGVIVTVNFTSGSTTTNLKHPDLTEMTAGQITANAIIEIVADGAYFQLVSISYAPVNRAGDTVSGNLTVAGFLQTNSAVYINSSATAVRGTYMQTFGSNRWSVSTTAEAESSTLGGSNFAISRFNNSGTYVDNILFINRATGGVAILYALSTGGNIICSGAIYGVGNISLSGPTSTQRVMYYQTSNIARWATYTDNSAESGSNTGSDFHIARYDDGGNFIDNTVDISRSTGIANFSHIPTFPTAATGNNSSSGATTNYVQTALSYYLQLAGGTISGSLGVNGALSVNGTMYANAALSVGSNATIYGNALVNGTISTNSSIYINGPTSTQRVMYYQTSNIARWTTYADSGAESGSNTGSDFHIARYDDGGNFIDNIMDVTRSTGIANFSHIPTLPTAATGNNSASAANTNYVQTALSYYLQLVGGTITGSLGVNGTFSANGTIYANNALSVGSTATIYGNALVNGSFTTNSGVYINGAVGTGRNIVLTTSGSTRWALYANTGNETGGDAGSDFGIIRFHDGGAYAGNPIAIARATGIVSFETCPQAPSPAALDNSNKLATTNYVQTALATTNGSYTSQTYGSAPSSTVVNTLTFIPSATGILYITGSINVGGTGLQPNGCQHQLYFNGSGLSGDSTISSMTNAYILYITAGYIGSTITIQNTYNTPGGSGYQSVSQSLTFIFVPN